MTSAPASATRGLDRLVETAARLTSQPVASAQRDQLRRAFQDLAPKAKPAEQFVAIWRAAGLKGKPARLHRPAPSAAPFVTFDESRGWTIARSRAADGTWRGIRADGTEVDLGDLHGHVCLSLPRRRSDGPVSAARWVRAAVWAQKSAILDGVVATALVSLLALGASLYSMQVYDRVIPAQGLSTLWVLTAGVTLSILLEMLFRILRNRTMDHACDTMERELNDQFFSRLLGVRMEARPATVGTLAAQVKGLEALRTLLSSTSLFVLADVPFGVPLLVAVALVGGWLVAVPLIALPVSLVLGLAFQFALARQAHRAAAAANRKVGVLVEAADGAEAVKAANGEWFLHARWTSLVQEAAGADRAIRNHAALGQNLTMAAQQLTYVALIAAGAVLVTRNELTMGALLACAILGNRALAPIVQLPGILVQWAQARSAIGSLQALVALPNEMDGASGALTPESLAPTVRFERVQFAYSQDAQPAVRVDKLEIRAGERVGLIGAIGSGKSTLLKLASGQFRPSEGKVFLGGVDAALLSTQVVREQIGYLPQEARLLNGTLRDNVILGLADPGDDAILAAARRTGLFDVVASHPRGLALEISEGGRGLSSGQKRLVGLTRLLLARPRIWLLDEPTDGLDSVTEARIVALLNEVAKEQDITLVISTHKSAVLPLLERLVVVQAGAIAADGPRDTVLARVSGRPQPVQTGAVA